MWRFLAARAVGKSHVFSGLSCQDHFACAVLPDGIFAAAIADGAGSAPMGERGADMAVNTSLKCILNAVENEASDLETVLRESAGEAREAVFAEAIKHGSNPRDFASTLLVAIIGPRGGAGLQIGDGAIVVNDGEEGWSCLFWPQRGEYVNFTRFLTDENSIGYSEVRSLPEAVTDIALMTDGLEPLALHYASKSAFVPFFSGIFRPLFRTADADEVSRLSDSLEVFLSSDTIRSRTDDDVSLVVATSRPSQMGK